MPNVATKYTQVRSNLTAKLVEVNDAQVAEDYEVAAAKLQEAVALVNRLVQLDQILTDALPAEPLP